MVAAYIILYIYTYALFTHAYTQTRTFARMHVHQCIHCVSCLPLMDGKTDKDAQLSWRMKRGLYFYTHAGMRTCMLACFLNKITFVCVLSLHWRSINGGLCVRSLVSSSALHTPLVFRRSNIISACLSLIVRLSFWLWFRAERGRAQGQRCRFNLRSVI